MVHKKQLLVLLLVASVLLAVTSADKGCPNSSECQEHCKAGGKSGKCEKRWYRWKYGWRCKCNPCAGKLVLGACVTKVGAGVGCDGNGQNCSPTFTG